MRKILKFFTSRLMLIFFVFLVQMILISWLLFIFNEQFIVVSTINAVVALCCTLYIIVDNENPMFKMTWILFISILPVFGVWLYLYSRTEKLPNSRSSFMNEMQERRIRELKKVDSETSPDFIKHQKYLNNLHFPGYKNTIGEFLADGKTKQLKLLEDLKKAKEFIFMEYFIITKSNMWNEILEVLIEKQKQGVEIRIMYDDLGSATKLPYYYHKELIKMGFKVVRFNPLRLRVKFSMNYRDHRKIVVIDNLVAFTGGFNIGDEYTNEKKVFGYWNDAGIRLEGEAVWSLTVLFLENWAFSKKERMEFRKYYRPHSIVNDSIYIPFGDIPSDKVHTGKATYLNLINSAKESIYITAPYLIIDNEISTALKLASESGVDVKIIIPEKPDKRMVYMVSESYVNELIHCKVKVYKFTPGFIHSKMIITDQKVSMIGTSNLDFRSLYMHLENNVWLNDITVINDMVSYYEQTLKVSKLITPQMMKKRNLVYRILQAILRSFATLM